MSEDAALIKEVQDHFEEERQIRQAEMEAAQQKDAEIIRKREAGEYGVSKGMDNVASQLMFVVATVVTIALVWMVFNVDPR
ncbi:MAG: hypothetical protein ACO4AU_07380 [bacterium]|jgi:hypothetical protein